jgi:hypothetical protein
VQTRHERYLLGLHESVKNMKLDLSVKESFQKLLNAEKLGDQPAVCYRHQEEGHLLS